MRRPVITRHARERALQRLGAGHTPIATLRRRSVLLPARYARRLAIRTPQTKSGIRFRVAGDVLLVCRGRRIITLWRLSADAFATVLVWIATGIWTGGMA
ncbi:MAG: hypothetical protein ACI9K2_006758 [Myxococcota bacterium]|jgi:hypothetical protein